MTRKEITRFLLLHSLGNFFVLFGLYGVGMTFGPAIYQEVLFRIDQATGVKYVVASVTQKPTDTNNASGFGDMFVTDHQRVLFPINTDFSVIIPKIGADAVVVPNVDPSNEDDYLKALKVGIAHAKGSVFPGIVGTTYLFAHSTDNFWDVGRYNAIFYLLKDLSVGDSIVVYFGGKRYDYAVDSSTIVDPNDVSLLVNAQKTQEQLVLQTCWPPGTTYKRLLVVAKRTN